MIETLELKNLKMFEGMEGYGFNADVWYNKKRVAHARDDAHGGEYWYDIFDKDAWVEIMRKVKQLPPEVSEYFPEGLERNMDSVINDLVVAKLREKEDKKGIWYLKDGKEYVMQWKWSLPTMIKKFPDKALPKIQEVYDKTKADGFEVINAQYLKSIGVKL